MLHPEWVIEHNGSYFFDPALPEVRQLIIDGAVELAENYDIDGIHMDDYFYPGPDFNDADSFAFYGSSFSDIGEWRRNNINILVGWLSIALHKASPNIEFGISPSGIWASSSLEPDGSNTLSTNSSYHNQYADSKLWVKSGWIDYIAPQIYWEIGHETNDFSILLDWWSNLIESSDVKLYIGLADYRTLEAESVDSPWYNGEEIARQLAACNTFPQIAGTIHFRYGSVASCSALQQVLSEVYLKDVFSPDNSS